MSVQQPPLPPWQTRQPSYILKFAAMFAFALLVFFGFGALLIDLMTFGASLSSGLGPGETWISTMPLFLGMLLFGGLCIFGAVKLYPIVSAPTNFKPSYGTIASETAGHPFEIRFQRTGWRRVLNGKGTARFDQESLLVEGWLTPSPIFQIALVLILTITPLVLFGFGLGVIPALLIAYYVGRKKLTLSIPYMELRELQMKGCVATFGIPTSPPGKVSFATAQVDGERLYREMRLHVSGAG